MFPGSVEVGGGRWRLDYGLARRRGEYLRPRCCYIKVDPTEPGLAKWNTTAARRGGEKPTAVDFQIFNSLICSIRV